MQFKDIIEKKRDGGKLSREEIEYFISAYTAGDIPDYQASALLMAVYFEGLDREETFYLTDAMKRSGDVADLSAIPGIKVDKHSTGPGRGTPVRCLRRTRGEDERTRAGLYRRHGRQNGSHSGIPHGPGTAGI